MSSLTLETPLRIEAITPEQLGALDRAIQPMEKIVTGFNVRDIDHAFGRGVLEAKHGQSHCIWNGKGIRFTMSVGGGGYIFTASREPDEYYLSRKA